MGKVQKIHLLDPLVAQRIAAGEVIERPASVVRELIDNAVDAHASDITLQIVEGGIERITVIDDGSGIQADDLPLCCRSHATSKVSTLEDLYKLDTMGFRGEALYSIAASARVTIASRYDDEEPATLVVDNGKEGDVRPGGPAKGTKVDVEHLFAAIPARRLFLKRPATESTMCRNVMVEKAMAFPHITFRMYDGDKLKLDLPATTPKQRILDALAHDKHLVPSETTELSDSASRFKLYALATTPACYRTDRSHIKIYINKRPIEEYALVQAITYGYGNMLPGGAFPYCYLFIEVDPELVDFNIHPAKREVKLRNKAEIHHQVVVMVRQQVAKSIPRLHMEEQKQAQQLQMDQFEQPSAMDIREQASFQRDWTKRHVRPYDSRPESQTTKGTPAQDWLDRAKQALAEHDQQRTEPPAVSGEQESFVYVGQVFDLFLIVQRGESLYLIDQHAAHERILYDQIRSDGGIQRLMVPIEFEVERTVDDFIQAHLSWYADHGLELIRIGDLAWELHTIPALWRTIEQDVVGFITSHATGDIAELEKKLYATIACHAAIKDGDAIDSSTAISLIRDVFRLEDPVCPHGRTFVVEITKDQLWRSVGRIM